MDSLLKNQATLLGLLLMNKKFALSRSSLDITRLPEVRRQIKRVSHLVQVKLNGKKKGHQTDAGRQRIALAQKARWANRRNGSADTRQVRGIAS